jgi:ankyrin repeat protein
MTKTATRIRPLVFLLSALMLGCSSGSRTPPRLGELYWLLDRACWSGDKLSVEILLKAGADPSGPRGYSDFHDHIDRIGIEPMWHLVQASYSGHPAVTRLLLRAGADPNLAYGEGVTALTVAADKGQTEIVRLLLAAGADKNYKSYRGTAAEIAERRGHTEILDLLRTSK